MKNIKKLIIALTIVITTLGALSVQASDTEAADTETVYNNHKLDTLIQEGMIKGDVTAVQRSVPSLVDTVAIDKFKNFILNNDMRKTRFKTAYAALSKNQEPRFIEVELELLKRFGPNFFDQLQIDVSQAQAREKSLAQRMTDKAQSISEAVERKWDQGKEKVGEAVESAKSWFSSAAKNVSDTWKKITAAPVRKSISELSRTECMNKFLYSIKNSEMNDALSCLAKEKFNIFDQDKQSLFQSLVQEMYDTPAKEQEKRALILFSLYQMYIFSVDKMNGIEEKVKTHKMYVSPDNLQKKRTQLKEAHEELQDILTQETVRKYI